MPGLTTTLTLARLTAVQNICPTYIKGGAAVLWFLYFSMGAVCHCIRILKNYLVISRKMITFASDI